MGWKADCACGMLRVVDTYGDYAAMCLYDHRFCYAAEPMDNSLKAWKVVYPERCELPEDENIPHKVAWKNDSGHEIWED